MANGYSNAKHRKWRDKVLKRDKYLCRKCKRYGRHTPATHAHHKLAVEDYPELRYDVDNGVALCAKCHNEEHPEKGRARKW